MIPSIRSALLLGLFAGSSVLAADQAVIKVANPGASAARSGEVVTVAFSEVRAALPGAMMHHLVIKDANGAAVPYQVTNFNPDDRRAIYDDLVFQHDFAAGETSATFTVEKSAKPVPPFPALVSARYVPERLDDFAWENDRLGHRMYGTALNTPAAGKSQLRSSGVDVWAKRVRYPIVDRWYNKGHDAYHVDTGEGLDVYSVGTARGCGGTGVWDGSVLHTSDNYATWKVLANGPIRAVFELGYAPWDAGNLKVSETKRFTVDAGRNLDQIESTFTIESGSGEAVIGIGIAKPKDATVVSVVKNESLKSLAIWQVYPKSGGLGCGIVLPPDAEFAGFAEDDANYLILVKARSGQPVRYYAGAGWDQSGDFADAGAWKDYLDAFARRLAAPVSASIAPAP